MKFNEKLINLRKKQGLSQEELGYKLNVTRQTVSKWELGQTTPEMDKLVEMSKIFNVSVDELVNETESTTDENLIIEDQTIEPETDKESKVKYIIIGILLIILIWIIVKIVTGFSIGNKKTEEQGFFDRFFDLFDKAISQQENIVDQQTNMMDNTDDMFNNMQNMMENIIGNASEQINKESFNGVFEIYAGSKMGASVISALDKIITSNKTEERIVTVKYMDTETQSEEEIKNIKHNIDKFGDYDLSYEYDGNGYIYKAIIEKY